MTDVVVGLVSGLHGVQGALKIKSFCEPAEGIFNYRPWTLARPGIAASGELIDNRASKSSTLAERHTLTECQSMVGVPIKIRGSGTSLAARFAEIEDRDKAGLWLGSLITVPRSCLPKLGSGDYYWRDLVGLNVENLQGVALGVVAEMIATGSNDVMVVNGDRQRLLPYIPGQFVMNVDLALGKIIVDWDPEF